MDFIKILQYYNNKILFEQKLNKLVDLYIIHIKNYVCFDNNMIKQIYKFNEHQKMRIIIA
jgi:hypothetical protein